MKVIRRVLGIFVMIAGLIGLLISLTGLVGLFWVRPRVVTSVNTTIATLTSSIETSQKVMIITSDALGASVKSVDALSATLHSTSVSVKDTKPVLAQMNIVMGKQLPATLTAATDSLKASQEAAKSLESTIQSLDTFRSVMSATPFLSAFVPASQEKYNPEKPLADSLGEVAVSLEDMPGTLSDMAANMDKADDNLDEIETNLTTMSESVASISKSLKEYQQMVGQSQESMESLKSILTGVETNLNPILNGVTIGLALLLIWLLTAQIVIFSQGWELFQGTAGRMEGSAQPK
jgi:archaellum component FlaC